MLFRFENFTSEPPQLRARNAIRVNFARRHLRKENWSRFGLEKAEKEGCQRQHFGSPNTSTGSAADGAAQLAAPIARNSYVTKPLVSRGAKPHTYALVRPSIRLIMIQEELPRRDIRRVTLLSILNMINRRSNWKSTFDHSSDHIRNRRQLIVNDTFQDSQRRQNIWNSEGLHSLQLGFEPLEVLSSFHDLIVCRRIVNVRVRSKSISKYWKGLAKINHELDVLAFIIEDDAEKAWKIR